MKDMSLKEIIKNMIRDFFIITTAVLISVIIFSHIFDPGGSFSVRELEYILLLGAATDLPTLIYYSPRDLTGKEVEIRFILQMVLIAVITLFITERIGWINGYNPAQIIMIIVDVCIISLLVRYGFWKRDKSLANKMNEKLKELREKSDNLDKK